MAIYENKNTYPQTYFLESEACKNFGIKLRTFKRWIDDEIIIPGRYKVKGTNYYVIEPVEFNSWYTANRLEPATNKNKFHNRKIKSKNSNRGSFTPRNKKSSVINLSDGGQINRVMCGEPIPTGMTQGGTT